MNQHKILFLDTETGGLNPNKNSLLSIGLAVWHQGVVIDSTEIFVNDGVLNVSEYALKVNNINLENHIRHALSPASAIDMLSNFVEMHFGKSHHVTLAGHNIGFDIAFLKCFYELNNIEFNKRYSHRAIDTSSIIQFLYHSEVLKENISSSDAAFKYFSIKVENRHSALGDAVATAELFNHLIAVCRN
jgi:DNA polymerase III alpha subunit (gram-positive type)